MRFKFLLFLCFLANLKVIAQTPTISSFSPSSGPVGTLITIIGTNLSNPNIFAVGGASAIVISNTGTQLVGFVMPGSITGAISITTANGNIASSNNFVVTTTPYPIAQQGAKLVGTGFSGASQQGMALALSADGNTAVVGGVGATWVFTRSGNTWSQQGSKLTGTGGTGTGQGLAVACSADGNTLITGDPSDNSHQGAAWVFTRTGNTWTQQGTKLVGAGSTGAASQGVQVALSADGNTAIIAGNQDNSNLGAAWVFTRSAGTWTQQGAKLTGAGATGAPYIGGSVALSADGNTVVLGAERDNGFYGSVWVFTRNAGVWTQQGNKITPSLSSQQFGWSVALSADGNTMLVGAVVDVAQTGAAWVFTRSGSTWSQQGSKLVGTGFTGIANQGNGVALSADGNTAVSAGYDDNSDIGAMWTFTRTGTTWAQQGSKLVGTGYTGNVVFEGQSVAMSADGGTTVLGGPADNGGIGATWVFTSTIPAIINATIATGNITACAGSASASPNIQQFTVSGSNLSANIIATAPAGFEVSLTAGSGYSNNLTLTQSGGVVNSTIYVRSAASAPAGTLLGNVVLSSSGATSQNVAVSGLVNALPKVNLVANQTVFNGAATAAINFTGVGNTFSWVNSMPGIGLAASGSGNIPSFTAVNTGSFPLTATITVTPAIAGFAYITSASDNNVSVINTISNAVVALIPVGQNPNHAFVNPSGSLVYIVNQGANTVSIINTATNTVISTINVTSPNGIAVSPDDKTLYAVNSTTSSLMVINIANNNVLASIYLGDGPGEIAISPDGSKVYVSNELSNSVSVINTSNNSLIGTISAGMSPIGLKVSPDGTRLYVAESYSNAVSVINTSTNSVINTIQVGSHPYGVCFSPDGSKVYVTNYYGNTVSVINVLTNTVTATLTTGTGPPNASVSPDGSELYVINQYSNNVSVFNTLNNTLLATVNVGKQPISAGTFISAGAACPGAPITFAITVNPTPNLSTAGTLSAINTTYGTPSPSTSFTVSGVNLNMGVLVTPPVGFEVSLDNLNFSNTLTIATTGVISSVPVYIRFTSATAVGTYSGNVILSSTGAQNINMAIPASIVNPTPLTIIANDASKTYGSTITNSSNSTAFSIAAGALKNGNTITSVNLTYGAGAAANTGVGTYLSVSPTINTIGNGFLRSNYNITYNMGNVVVTPAPLTIAANSINKPNGTALATTTTFTGFAATGLQNQETIGSVVLNYGAGSAMTDPAGLYQGSVVPSSPSGGTFSVSNYNITYINGDITVEPQIAISASGTLGSLSTTYGTASRSTNFTVSGTNLSADILVAPPSGFEVSTDNIQFYPTVTIGTGGNIASTQVYIRLTALTAVGNYAGNILLNSAGITNTSLVMPQSTVITTALTISADNKSKVFGTNNPNLTVSYSGFVNKETVAVINTLPAITTTASKASAVGQYAITASGAISPNYSINYVQGVLTITPLPISIVIPNTFTPNGDGFNDIWNIPALAFYSNNNVSVFDKSGTRVFYSLGYGNPWDGNYNGSKLPLGTYYYIIMVEMSKKTETLSGSVTIIR